MGLCSSIMCNYINCEPGSVYTVAIKALMMLHFKGHKCTYCLTLAHLSIQSRSIIKLKLNKLQDLPAKISMNRTSFFQHVIIYSIQEAITGVSFNIPPFNIHNLLTMLYNYQCTNCNKCHLHQKQLLHNHCVIIANTKGAILQLSNIS